MNATPLLKILLSALNESKLEVIMIGNAGAAILGAPITTLDFDFLFRKTDTNLKKLKNVAELTNSVLMRPYFPVSNLYRLVNDDLGLQADFMTDVHGIKSYASLRFRSHELDLWGFKLMVADLSDIIKSKKVANREKDRAVIPVLESTLKLKEPKPKYAKAKTKTKSSPRAKKRK